MRRTTPILVALGLLVGTAAVSAHADLTADFRAAVEQLRTDHAFPGATAAYILPDGAFDSVGVGFADVEMKRPMGIKERMLCGGIGKNFVAAVTMDLASEGQVDLDGKISQWLGDKPWFDRLPNAQDVTLRMLLGHTAGLPDHVQEPAFADAVKEHYQGGNANPDFYFTPDQLVAFILDKKPLFPAGQGYSYSDTDYILVGMIIEKVTGQTYYDVLEERFLGPLKLAFTDPANQRALAGLAAGYVAPDNAFGYPAKNYADRMLIMNPLTEWTGGGLVTTSSDLVRWAKDLFEGKAIPQEYVDMMLKSPWKEENAKPDHYGLGVQVIDTPLGPAYGHTGWFPGYSSAMFYFPKQKIAVAIQVNTDDNQPVEEYINALAQVVARSTT